MWPGTSRSMMDNRRRLFCRVSIRGGPPSSAFLLGFVTLTAATMLQELPKRRRDDPGFGWPHVLLGCVVAALSAAAAVRCSGRLADPARPRRICVYRLVTAAALAAWFLI
jgi:undecaprenyl-diphosphatase